MTCRCEMLTAREADIQDTLLVCPFCGGDPVLSVRREPDGDKWFASVHCVNPDCDATLWANHFFWTREEAVRDAETRWNRRVR